MVKIIQVIVGNTTALLIVSQHQQHIWDMLLFYSITFLFRYATIISQCWYSPGCCFGHTNFQVAGVEFFHQFHNAIDMGSGAAKKMTHGEGDWHWHGRMGAPRTHLKTRLLKARSTAISDQKWQQKNQHTYFGGGGETIWTAEQITWFV